MAKEELSQLILDQIKTPASLDGMFLAVQVGQRDLATYAGGFTLGQGQVLFKIEATKSGETVTGYEIFRQVPNDTHDALTNAALPVVQSIGDDIYYTARPHNMLLEMDMGYVKATNSGHPEPDLLSAFVAYLQGSYALGTHFRWYNYLIYASTDTADLKVAYGQGSNKAPDPTGVSVTLVPSGLNVSNN